MSQTLRWELYTPSCLKPNSTTGEHLFSTSLFKSMILWGWVYFHSAEGNRVPDCPQCPQVSLHGNCTDKMKYALRILTQANCKFLSTRKMRVFFPLAFVFWEKVTEESIIIEFYNQGRGIPGPCEHQVPCRRSQLGYSSWHVSCLLKFKVELSYNFSFTICIL